MNLVRLPLSLLSPAGPRGRLSILIFHRVFAEPDALWATEPDARVFETQMRWVRDWFNVLPLHDALRRLRDGTLPARAMSVTFDDGYADNESVAAPILARLGLSATFFVSTGYLDGSCMWNDRIAEALRRFSAEVLDLRDLGLRRYDVGTPAQRRQALVQLILDAKHVDAARRHALVGDIVARTGAPEPRALMMSPAQVRHLRELGMDVGAHTVTHPILTRVSIDAARAEIADSRRHLEQVLQAPVTLFAYPNGHPHHDYAAEHVALVREAGFEAAVTTAPGVCSVDSDPFQLPRFAPWHRRRWRYGTQLLGNFARRAETVSLAALPQGA